MDEITASHIIRNDDRIELIYHHTNKGCLLTAIAILVAMLLFILIFLPGSILFAGLGIIISVVGLIVVGALFMKLRSVFAKGYTLITIENGTIRNDKNSVPLSDIKEIRYSWYLGAFKSIVITTHDNKTYTFPSYNLVPDTVLEQFVDQYVIPYGGPNIVHHKDKLDHHEV